MRNKRWLRYGLGSFSVAAAVFSAVLVACGDDDDNNSRTDGGTPIPDGGSPDSSNPDGGPPVPAKLQLVNAATDFGTSNPLGALRVCYGVGATAESIIIPPLPPLPNRPAPGAPEVAGHPLAAVFIGTGGAVEGTGADLSTRVVVPFLMNAVSLAMKGLVKPDAGPGVSCDAMLKTDFDAGGGPLQLNVDYWKLDPIPAGRLLANKSYILALTGCTGDSDLPTEKCGADFVKTGPGNGNLKVNVYEVERTTIATDKIGTQFIHVSAQLAATGAEAKPGYTSDPMDAGAFKSIQTDPDASVAYGSLTPLAQVSGVNVSSDSFTANPAVPALALPLPTIQLLSYGANVPDGGNYRNGAAFTFIAVGDPAADGDAGGRFNTKKFHYIALPNDPDIRLFEP